VEQEGHPVTFDVIDVGGQKNERSKWLHAFDDVTAVIFLVGTSEFDQKMREEKLGKNRMVDALECFEKWVCNPTKVLTTAASSRFDSSNVPHAGGSSAVGSDGWPRHYSLLQQDGSFHGEDR